MFSISCCSFSIHVLIFSSIYVQYIRIITNFGVARQEKKRQRTDRWALASLSHHSSPTRVLGYFSFGIFPVPPPSSPDIPEMIFANKKKKRGIAGPGPTKRDGGSAMERMVWLHWELAILLPTPRLGDTGEKNGGNRGFVPDSPNISSIIPTRKACFSFLLVGTCSPSCEV